MSEGLSLVWGFCFSSRVERDARPCRTRVRYVWFERCLASALSCVGLGPLGDALGSLSLVMASVCVVSVEVMSCEQFKLSAAVLE